MVQDEAAERKNFTLGQVRSFETGRQNNNELKHD